MKKIIATALFALASLVVMQSSSAQNYKVKASIPFNFVVGSNTLPAGTYTFSSQDNLALHIQNDKKHATILSSVPADGVLSENIKLVFTMYGDQYFLSKIFCPSSNLNLELPVSKLEKKARLQEVQLTDLGLHRDAAHHDSGK